MKNKSFTKKFIIISILSLFLFLFCLLFISYQLKYIEINNQTYISEAASTYLDTTSDPFISSVKVR